MEKGLPKRVKQHYDYIQAREYAMANKKNLKDLTYNEMQMFKRNAEVIKFSEIEPERLN